MSSRVRTADRSEEGGTVRERARQELRRGRAARRDLHEPVDGQMDIFDVPSQDRREGGDR
jgi:hypothetical protein